MVGESGSGKTTVSKKLEEEGCNIIHSYTTRDKRTQNEWGHIFVNKFEKEKDAEDIIAYTYYNGNHYWAVKSQYQNKGKSIYVIDVDGINYLRKKVTDAAVLVIYLQADKITRFKRMALERGPINAYKRIKNDLNDFNIVPCDYKINANQGIKKVLKNIREVINE